MLSGKCVARQLFKTKSEMKNINYQDREEIIKVCLDLLPGISESTRKIVNEIIYKKNVLGKYLVQDENDLRSLVEYLEENSDYI